VWAAYPRVQLNDLIAETGLHRRGLGRTGHEQTAATLRALSEGSRHWMVPQGLTGDLGAAFDPARRNRLRDRLARLAMVGAFLVPLVHADLAREVAWIDGIHEHIWGDTPIERRQGAIRQKTARRTGRSQGASAVRAASWLADRAETLIAAANVPSWRAMNRRMRPIAAAVVVMLAVIGGR